MKRQVPMKLLVVCLAMVSASLYGQSTPIVQALPGMDFALDTSACADTEVTVVRSKVTDDELYSVAWEYADGDTTEVNDTTFVITFSNAGEKEIALYMTKDAVTDTLKKTITIHELPGGEFVIPADRCDEQAFEINFESEDTTVMTRDLIGMYLTVDSLNDSTYQITADTSGMMKLKYTAFTEYCSVEDSIEFEVFALPTGDFVIPEDRCDAQAFEINFQSSDTNVLTSDLTGMYLTVDSLNDSTYHITADTAGMMKLNYTAFTEHCMVNDSIEFEVFALPEGEFVVPDVRCGEQAFEINFQSADTNVLTSDLAGMYLTVDSLTDSTYHITADTAGVMTLNYTAYTAHCSVDDSIQFEVYEIPGAEIAYTDSICQGDSTIIEVVRSLEGAEVSLQIDTMNYEVTGDRFAFLSDTTGALEMMLTVELNGCSSDSTFAQEIVAVPALMLTYSEEATCIGDTVELMYKVSPESAEFTYASDAVWPEELNDSTIRFVFDESGEIILKATNAMCMTEDTIFHEVHAAPETPEICYVTYDTASGLNHIMWANENARAMTYTVYRDDTLITDLTAAEGMMTFVDSTSNPDETEHTYSIKLVDSCGLESEMGIEHTTVYMETEVTEDGIELTWNDHQGVDALAYQIFRGESLNDLKKIAAKTGAINSFIDNDQLWDGTWFYQVVVLGTACDDEGSVRLMSNISSTTIVGSGEAMAMDFGVYPNPTNGILNFSFGAENELNRVEILDLNGKVILTIGGFVRQLDVSALASGQYIVQAYGGKGIARRLIYKN